MLCKELVNGTVFLVHPHARFELVRSYLRPIRWCLQRQPYDLLRRYLPDGRRAKMLVGLWGL